MTQIIDLRWVEIHSFKWQYRPTSIARARWLGEDRFGVWLGVNRGDPWWRADRTAGGLFVESLVKLVPHNTFWSVCFQRVDPGVDVDIILPVRWQGDLLEEVDLELDILRNADGTVYVRDQDKFEQVRVIASMPDKIVAQALATCEQIRELVERRVEPFGEVGRSWLDRFMTQIEVNQQEQRQP